MASLQGSLKVTLSVVTDGLRSPVLELDDENLWVSLYIHYRNLHDKVDIPDLIQKVKGYGTPKPSGKALNQKIIVDIMKNHWKSVEELQRFYPTVKDKHHAAALFRTARVKEKIQLAQMVRDISPVKGEV